MSSGTNSSLYICNCCLKKSKNMHDIIGTTAHVIVSKLLTTQEEKVGTYPRYLCKSCNLKLEKCITFLNQLQESIDKISHESVENEFLENIPINNSTCSFCQFISQTHMVTFCKKHSHIAEEFNIQCKSRNIECKEKDLSIDSIQDELLDTEDPKICFEIPYFNEPEENSVETYTDQDIHETTELLKNPELNEIAANLTCFLCQKTYKTRYKLKEHIKIHTGDLPFKCRFCDKKSPTKSCLKNHERCHTKEKPFICNVCGKGLSAASALRTHLKQHTGRPEQCHICSKTFCRKSELTLHMQKHKGDRPFLCTICGSSFGQKSHLTEHQTMHNDVRPFKCNQCDKSFKKSTLLKQHQALHKGEKNFKCTRCSYACYKRYRLTQHEKIHNVNGDKNEKQNICPVCNKDFKSISVLHNHVSNVHNAIL